MRFAQLGGERPRVWVWLHGELTLEQRFQVFVVLQRVGSAPAGSEHAHDQTVRILAQTAHSYGPVGGVEGGLVVAGLELLLAELHHRIERQPFQALALGLDPFRPRLLRDRHFGQQMAPVEADRSVQGIPAAVREQRLEPRHVARDCARLEGNRFAGADERVLAQDTAQPG